MAGLFTPSWAETARGSNKKNNHFLITPIYEMSNDELPPFFKAGKTIKPLIKGLYC
jgi:hypothetical protein